MLAESDLFLDSQGLVGFPLQARIAARGRGLTTDETRAMVSEHGWTDDDVAAAYDVILGRDS